MNSYYQSMLQTTIEAFRGGNFELAGSTLNESLRIDIASANSIFDLGITYAEVGRYDEALTILYCLQPFMNSDARIPYNIGLIHSMQGKHRLALEACDLALKIQPDDIATLINKGAVHNEIKDFSRALETLDYAIQLNQTYPEAYSNKANALNELKRYDEAIANYDKALSLNPDFAEAYSNKANALNQLKRYEEAIAHFDKALSLKSKIEWIFGEMIHAKMKIGDWSNFDKNLQKLINQLEEGNRITPPFQPLSLVDNPTLHLVAAKIFINEKFPAECIPPELSKTSHERIRIGYFSADFKHHAVSILTAELYELHDKNQFEVIAFSFGADDHSPMRLRLKQAFSQFIDVTNTSDKAVAKLARDIGIDIAVDLGGFTSHSRTGIFAHRAAPIQVSYVGYLGTMGSDYMDYLVADKTIIPAGSEYLYSEKIAYLPSYQVNDRKRIISDKKFTRKNLGLPEYGFVFCCLNNNYKILPSTFDGWMRILKAVDSSVLYLYAENSWAEENLKKEAGARGICSERLVFGKFVPTEEYLAHYRVCDLFLDTFPYNAGTTASDALWAGLPVLTLLGKSFASRVAASLLNGIGLPELVTNTQEEYEGLAIELALNPKKLAAIKLKLANNRLTTPLFDTPLFAKNLEAAYSQMYQRYQMGLAPEHIAI